MLLDGIGELLEDNNQYQHQQTSQLVLDLGIKQQTMKRLEKIEKSMDIDVVIKACKKKLRAHLNHHEHSDKALHYIWKVIEIFLKVY